MAEEALKQEGANGATVEPEAIPICPACKADLEGFAFRPVPLPNGKPGLILFCQKCRAFLQVLSLNIAPQRPSIVDPNWNPTRRM